jgi:hypothetical protein
MLPVGFEPTISAGERPQTYALVEMCEEFILEGVLHLRSG